MNLMEANRQWANRPADQRFETLQALLDNVQNRRNRSRAVDLEINKLSVKVESDRLLVNGQILPTEPTHWSFGQLCGLIGAPAGYLRTLPTDKTADLVNYGLKNTAREAFKVMTVLDPNGEANCLQAVTTTTYGRIWDADVIGAAMRIVEKTGGRFFNPKAYNRHGGGVAPSGLYASDRDCFMFLIDGGSLLDAGGERDQLHRGFFMWNSEVGAAKFGLKTFLFRAACGNHIVWDASDVKEISIRHTSGGPARFDREAAPALLEYVNQSAAPMEAAIRLAKKTSLLSLVNAENNDQFVSLFAKKFNFTRGEILEAMETAKKEEGQCENLWDMVNGLTACAREYAFIDSRIELEKRAGALMEIVKN